MASSSNDPNAAKRVAQQYATAGNLNARKNLHAMFSTNPRGWYPWFMDQLDLPANARILELGCGTADIWRVNLGRLSAGWHVTLTDSSTGMIQAARKSLASYPASSPNPFTFAIADAQAVPFPDASFDAVIANHMIYHIPDRALGIREMRRVLRPSGKLYAATNGERHMVELDALIRRLAPDITANRVADIPRFSTTFTLENGEEQLSQAFKTVKISRYPDSLVVTEAQPLVDYVLSMTHFTFNPVSEDARQAFLHAVMEEIQARGAIQIGKDTGLLTAS